MSAECLQAAAQIVSSLPLELIPSALDITDLQPIVEGIQHGMEFGQTLIHHLGTQIANSADLLGGNLLDIFQQTPPPDGSECDVITATGETIHGVNVPLIPGHSPPENAMSLVRMADYMLTGVKESPLFNNLISHFIQLERVSMPSQIPLDGTYCLPELAAEALELVPEGMSRALLPNTAPPSELAGIASHLLSGSDIPVDLAQSNLSMLATPTAAATTGGGEIHPAIPFATIGTVLVGLAALVGGGSVVSAIQSRIHK